MLIDQQTLHQVFGTATLQRGKRYFSEQRVLYLKINLRGASIRELDAVVEGSSGRTYQTRVAVDPYSPWALTSDCSCPVEVDCKHGVAVLLEANRRLREDGQQTSTLASREQGRQFAHWLNELEERLAPRTQGAKENLFYILAGARYGGALEVTVEKARIKKNGEKGRGSPTTAWATADLDLGRPKYIEDVDVPALIALKAFSSAFRLSPMVEGITGASFLAAAVKTGRLFWQDAPGTPLAAGETLRTGFSWQQGPDERWHLVLTDLPDNLVMTPTDPPWYIDTEELVLGRLEVPVSAGALEVLLATPPLQTADIVRNLPTLKPLLERVSIGLPEGIREPETISPAPVPVLQLFALAIPGGQPQPSLMVARLLFDYDGIRLSPLLREETVRHEHNGEPLFVQRNLQQEREGRQEIVEFLPLHGTHWALNLPADLANDLTLPSHEDWLDFLAWKLPALEVAGWQVEMDESFNLPVVEATDWYAESHAVDDAEGWFDLELGMVQDGLHINLVPLLQKALEFLRPELALDDSGDLALPDSVWLHDDEQLIRIPAERIRPMLETLLELYRPKDPDQPLRLPRIEAARLIGRSEADWRGGEQLQALGRKLTGFSGLDTVAIPDGLQAELRHYQQDGLDWLQFLREANLGGVLADDMGLGKTLQTLAHLWVEKCANRLDAPALVVCPTSVIPNWKAEATRFTPALKVMVLHGPQRKQQFPNLGEADLVITSYPLLGRDIALHEKSRYAIAIFDEAQNLKNPKAAVSRAARKVSAGQKVVLTGTPMENHLGELWSLFDLVLPGYLGSHEEFREFFRTPIERNGDSERRSALSRRIRPFLLRRTKEQVTPELPEKTEMVRMIELNRGQRDLYETIRASMDRKIRELMADKGIARSQIEILEALLKLRQVCCHPALIKGGSNDPASAKLDYLLEMVAELLEEGRKIIIFSQFTSMLALIEEALKARGLSYALLTGQTRDRAKPVAQFQEGEVSLFLISLKAGGVGLNLVAADTVIHYDPWWNPAVESQATDRAWRIGQDKPVFVYQLICESTVEERMQVLKERKSRLAQGVYGAADTFSASLTPEDVQALFEPLG